ncbi:MAG: hypothetical protein ABSH13_07220 [Candidatus Acidiferrum sp.]
MRGSILENFAGDLEYNPRRAAIYFALAIASFSFWFFAAPKSKPTTTPIVFGLGSLTLLLKGIFLVRKSSEGLALTQYEMDKLSSTSQHGKLQQLPELAAQIVQDFGAGPLLLWPVLNMAKDVDASWTDPPRWPIILSGGVLFGLGWLIRSLTRTGP